MDISKSPSNPEWELISTTVERNVEKYKCCPEPYPDVTYIVVLKRRERSYWMNFIFPGIFLTGDKNNYYHTQYLNIVHLFHISMLL